MGALCDNNHNRDNCRRIQYSKPMFHQRTLLCCFLLALIPTAFAAGTDQSDDITCLALVFRP